MSTAVLFLTAETGNSPNVHQQETGREGHGSDGILHDDTEGGSTHTVRWESQEAHGHVRKEQRNEGGRKHVNLPKILGSHIFPPVFQNLWTVLLLS